MKKLILILTLTISLFALNYEYPQTYKDTKVMGMGGANVAVGGSATAVFYNPAGLKLYSNRVWT